ncbi:MAG: hypothetical protein ACLUPG_01500 [Roseburia faecis]|jgi:hypothetical protein
MGNKDNLQYSLRLWMLVTIITVYIGTMIIGSGVLIYILCCYDFKSHILMHTVLASISGALCTCGMQYVKRMYKACIYKRVEIIADKNAIECIGNFIYFMARPLFAIAFVIIFIFAIKAGIIVIMDTGNWVENDKFLYVCTVISCVIGFSVGRVLDMFQEISIKGIEKVKGDKNG